MPEKNWEKGSNMGKSSISMKDFENISSRDAFGKALMIMGKKVPELVLLGADSLGSTRGAAFAKKFPQRTFNFGIAEQEMIAAAAGFATCGKIPIATAYGFLISMRACEQVRTDICYPNLNVKLMATHTGLSMATGGTTHHCTEDIAIMRSFANLIIVAPSDAVETAKAVESVIYHQGPVYLRMGRGKIPNIYSRNYDFEIGKSILLRKGSDVTIIAFGIMLTEALEAAEVLAKENIQARVINMHTIKPIDKDAIIDAASETGAIVTAEEHTVCGGLGEAVAGVTSAFYPVPLIRIGIQDIFCGIGPENGLRKKLGLTAHNIIRASKKVILMKK
jgi:transketolase